MKAKHLIIALLGLIIVKTQAQQFNIAELAELSTTATQFANGLSVEESLQNLIDGYTTDDGVQAHMFRGNMKPDKIITFDFGETVYKEANVIVHGPPGRAQNFTYARIRFVLNGVEQENIVAGGNDAGIFTITSSPTTEFNKVVIDYYTNTGESNQSYWQWLYEIEILVPSYLIETRKGRFSHLEIGFNADASEDILNNSVLGVNGTVYILNNTEVTDIDLPHINSYDNFSLWVEKGVVGAELGIGVFGTTVLADYVFEEDYKLPSLLDIKDYVYKYKHLPGVIGQKELNDKGYYGVNEMLIGQLKNLEELTLHTISQEKQIKQEDKAIDKLKALASSLEKQLTILENK